MIVIAHSRTGRMNSLRAINQTGAGNVGASATSRVGSKKDTGYLYKPSESRARINTPCPPPIYRPFAGCSGIPLNLLKLIIGPYTLPYARLPKLFHAHLEL